MPDKNGTGPPSDAIGPQDGRGEGHGFHTNEKGTGKRKGGQKGSCE